MSDRAIHGSRTRTISRPAGGDARSLESNEAAVEAFGYGLAAIAAMSTLRDGRTEPMFVSDRAELLDQLGALMSGSSASVAQGGFRLAKEVLEFQDYWKLTATPRWNWRESLPQPRKL